MLDFESMSLLHNDISEHARDEGEEAALNISLAPPFPPNAPGAPGATGVPSGGAGFSVTTGSHAAKSEHQTELLHALPADFGLDVMLDCDIDALPAVCLDTDRHHDDLTSGTDSTPICTPGTTPSPVPCAHGQEEGVHRVSRGRPPLPGRGRGGMGGLSRAEIRRARAARNRCSARRSRLRKKEEGERDRQKAVMVQERNERLKRRVCELREKVVGLQQVVRALGMEAETGAR